MIKKFANGKLVISTLIKYRMVVHAFCLISCVAAFFCARNLGLRTDFSELLPQELESVQALKTASERIGGTGLLIVGVESPSFLSNRRFVDDFVKEIQPWVGKSLRFYEYRFDEAINFTQTFGLHYLDNLQLEDFRKFIADQETKKWDSAVSGFLGFDDDDDKKAAAKKDEAKPEAAGQTAEQATQKATQSLEDLFKNHPAGPAIGAVLDYPDGYLSAYKGKVLAVAMRPFSTGLSVSESRHLMSQTDEIIHRLDPSKYNPKMKTVFAGSVPQAVEEFDTISHDIFGTALELVILIAIALFLFLWSFRLILLLSLNLAVAVLWTFALTWLHIGYLNAQTAFLGSLVVGTGINYGVIYVCRFIEMRRHGKELEDALSEALETTLLPTLIAALTTSSGFLVLLLASNKGLSQFGFIGSVGIVLCWLCSFFLFPLWMYELERHSKKVRLYHNPLAKLLAPVGIRLGDATVRHYRGVLIASAVFLLLAFWRLGPLVKNPLEYNFNNLRNKTSTTAEVEAFRDRVYDAFPTSLTPSLAFADNEADARAICPTVRNLIATLPPDKNVIRGCSSYFDLLPDGQVDQGLRVAKMKEIQKLLLSPRLKFAEQGDLLRGMGEKMSFNAPVEKDLPDQLKRPYREQNGKVGLFATINPDGKKPLNDARNLVNFTDSLTGLRAGPDKALILVAGDSFVLADILRGLKKEGPLLTGLAFVAVLLITFFLAGGLWSGVLVATCLITATCWMLGVQSEFGLKYNFFNFIALPLTFGIGIDYPINVFIRYRQEGFTHFGRVFSGSGMAVLLCSLTTTIGYYTLMHAASQALAGFGKLAIIGEATCLVTALFLLPALMASGLFRKRFAPKP